jgi:hypothetical protein|nr:MAG TPA: hypothetical protein [Caudoviricetes sp.]
MIKIEKTEVYGWEAAIRGMRNPMNSWEKSDSGICFDTVACHTCRANRNHCKSRMENKEFVVGSNDLDLMMRLRNAGTDHRKFMRMITVYFDITAPLYWWKEFDTYKVGTVANSCSTMHKIHEKEFTLEDFSIEHLAEDVIDELFGNIIDYLNFFRWVYIQHNDKSDWWQMIQLLPSSYNQRRTIMLNYEVLANIYKSRRNHKLDEWRQFCEWIESLPYAEGLILIEV